MTSTISFEPNPLYYGSTASGDVNFSANTATLNSAIVPDTLIVNNLIVTGSASGTTPSSFSNITTTGNVTVGGVVNIATNKFQIKWDNVNGFQIFDLVGTNPWLHQGNTTNGSVKSKNNTLDNGGVGDALFAGSVSASASGIQLKWDGTNGCQVVDQHNSQVWLTQGGTTVGKVVTKAGTVIDDGLGNMIVALGINTGGDFNLGNRLVFSDFHGIQFDSKGNLSFRNPNGGTVASWNLYQDGGTSLIASFPNSSGVPILFQNDFQVFNSAQAPKIFFGDKANLGVLDYSVQIMIPSAQTRWPFGVAKNGVELFSVTNSGDVNVGRDLYVLNGSIHANNPIIGPSDRRLKDITGPLPFKATETILQLEPKQYSLKNDLTQKIRYGLIAQDVQKILPELIHSIPDVGGLSDLLGINYTDLIPVLVKSIQELSERVQALEKR